MKLSHALWCALVAVAALTPLGVKAITWLRPRPQPVDPAMADAGKTLFTHEWTAQDSLSPGGDGLGPVFNASSCVACHEQAGPGGGGGLQHNVTMFTVLPSATGGATRVGVIHARSTRYQETLAQVSPELPNISRPALADLLPDSSGRRRITFPSGVSISQRNTPALFGAKLIDDMSDEAIVANERAERLQWGLSNSDRDDVPVGHVPRVGGGRVGRFGWKAQTATLGEFVQAACANELGLGNPGQAQPKPLTRQDYRSPGLDLTNEQCDQLTAFVRSLPRPVERAPDDAAGRERADAGKKLFHAVGCADCHTPNVGSVEGVYSDLLLHHMGVDLEAGGYYGDMVATADATAGSAAPGEWRTPPLWGVADSAPYLHDGRAATLADAIKMHGGQGARAAKRFVALSQAEQAQLLAFLGTLRAP